MTTGENNDMCLCHPRFVIKLNSTRLQPTTATATKALTNGYNAFSRQSERRNKNPATNCVFFIYMVMLDFCFGYERKIGYTTIQHDVSTIINVLVGKSQSVL